MPNNNQPTQAMIDEAKKGLAWRREFNRGGTPIGVARARDISNGKNIPFDTVKRMHSYFSRHAIDKNALGFRPGEKGYPSNGRIAWALWGGDAGDSWSKVIIDRFNKEVRNMNHSNTEEFLEHYGIRGMHWGIRNKKTPVPASVDARKAYALKAKPMHALTNKQLKVLNERMNLESNYVRLNPSQRHVMKKRAEVLLGAGATASFAGFMNSSVGKKATEKGTEWIINNGPKLAEKLSYKIVPKIGSLIP